MATTLAGLDLAALLCSRVCHDLISPTGAIVNGLEVLEESKDEETREFALALIKKSATQATARLQFCRLAFGAAGSAGTEINLGDAETVARGFIEDMRHLEPGHALEHLGVKVMRRAGAAGTIGQLARIGFAVCNKFFDRAHW